MTRPSRNLAILTGLWLVCLVGGYFVWPVAGLPIMAAMFAAALVSLFVGRAFFVGRRAIRDKRWVDALMAFDLYEKQLRSTWRRRLSFLGASLYSFDALAIVRNNRGYVHLANNRLDLAEASFRDALERDPLYAVPHVNLAVVAAKRGDAQSMDSELAAAKRLGFNNRKAQTKVRALLKTFGEAAGKAV